MTTGGAQTVGEKMTADQLLLYFCFARTEDGSTILPIDSFLPLVAALSGISSQEAWGYFLRTMTTGPAQGGIDTPLVTQNIDAYARLTGLDRTKIIGSSTFSNQRDRAFSQRLEENGKYRIDVWQPAGGLFAYASLLMSHLTLILTPDARPVGGLGERVTRYQELLAMLATAAAEGGTVVIQNLEIEPALSRCIPIGMTMFQSAFAFTVFHELAHVELGHLDSPPRDAADRRQRELDADGRALARLHQFKWPNRLDPLFGAAITLISKSVVSAGPDDMHSATHPSLVLRMQSVCSQNDSVAVVPPGSSSRSLDLYLRNAFISLHDRDRCPEWFGQTRREVLHLPPDHVFVFKKIDFESQGRLDTDDVTRAKPQTRDLLPLLKKKQT